MSTRPYTDIPELLVLLSEKNIIIKLKNENIELIDVGKNLNQELINQIKVRKSEIIQFLKLYEKKEEYVAIPIAKTKEYYALSSMQKRLYFLWEIDKTLTNYNMPDIVLLRKPISKEKLTSIIKAICQRHEMLRASFHYFNENHYLKIADYALPNIDCIETDEENVLKTIKNFVQPFDLSKAPLLRFQLVNIKNGDQLLLIDIHHIISDGISNGILKKEFLSLYSGNALEPIKIQYKDFTEWQNSEEYKEMIGRQEKYWLDQYSNEVNVIQLPTDFPRPKNQNFSGDDVSFTINKNLSDSLKKNAQDNGGTLFITLLSIFNILLHKLTDQEDIVIGVPVAGRNHPDLGNIIGFFINTLALRNETKAETTFIKFCEQVKENTFKAFDNQDYGFGELVDRINVSRDTSRNPLFDVMFNLLNHRESKSTQQSNGKYSELYKIAKFDLTLTSTVGEDEILCSFNYSTNLFKRTTIQRFVKYFLNIIEEVSNNGNIRVSDIEILSESERNQLLYEFNDTKVNCPKDKTILDLFEAQVKSTPSAIAVKKANNQISFLELNNRANRIGKLLRDKGVARNDIVAIIAERSIDMIIGIYGILKAGAAYLPIDPNYPDERKALMIDKSKCKVLLTKKHLLDKVSEELLTIILDDKEIYNGKCGELKNISTPNDLIYVIFTSGSTGIPKGSAIKNRTFVNLIYWYNKELEVSSKDNILLMASISFDLAQKNLFVFLLNGACLHLSEENNLNYEEVANNIEKNNISIINCAPIAFYQLLSKDINDNFRNLSSLRKVMLGGEPINKKMFTEWRATQYFNTDVINSYGPTECTDVVTFHTVEEEEWNVNNSIPIGNPIDNASIYILNKYDQINPVGIAGELCIGGIPVSDGYLYDPLLTKEKFVKNLFGEGLMYKTGDLAKWLSNGKIEYLGRIDHQIKIRGMRIELGEIESTLLKHEKIKDAVVIASGGEGEEYICAYIVSEEELATDELRLHLSQTLPDHMLPSYFVRLESIPLTPNRKIDKKALPEPKFEEGDGYVVPSNEIEEKLVAIWSEVLKLDKERISINRSFFELGGHSLKATLMVNKILKEFKIEVPLKEVFTHQDIANLSKYLQGAEKSTFSIIEKAQIKEHYKLSSAQRRLLFLFEFDKTSLAYNMPQIAILEGEVDKKKLSEVFNKLIAHHESLRTYFQVVNDEAVQKISNQVNFEIEYFQSHDDGVQKIIKTFIRPFDLNTAPLIRAGLIEISPQKCILMVDKHHIITDGVSDGVLIKDFMTLYNDEELPELRLEYKDYAEWQQSEEQKKDISRQKEFWLNEFIEDVNLLEIPTDFKRPSILSYIGETIGFKLSSDETSKLKLIADTDGVTMYMVLLSIYNILLSKLSNQEDVVVGTPVAGRQHIELENIIGMFVNTLPLRNYPKGEVSFKDFLKEIKNKTLECFDNQSYQLEELIDELKLARDTSHNPLFEVMFVFQNFESETLEIPGLKLKPYSSGRKVSHFDLTLTAVEAKENIYLSFEYSTKLFKKETIEKFITYFKKIVSDIITDQNKKISEIELTTEKEKKQLLYEFNDTKIEYPREKTIIDLFEEQVEKYPNNKAIQYEEVSLSYKALNEKVNQLSHFLRQQISLQSNDFIGLIITRSEWMIISILGILKTGAAYVPIDPSHPQSRIDHMMKDCDLKAVLTIDNFKHQVTNTKVIILEPSVIQDQLICNVGIKSSANNFAYVMYTSGSTGIPKGTLISNYSVNRVVKNTNYISISQNDKILQLSNYAFDGSVFDIFGALLNGATLIMIGRDDLLSIDKLGNTIKNKEITVFFVTTALFNTLVDLNLSSLKNVRKILFGGEKVSLAHTKKALNYLGAEKIIHVYGPTESCVFSTFYPINKIEETMNTIPIGKPLANTKVLVLDKRKKLLPIGIAGELCISGDGLSSGYHKREDLTKEKFISNPYLEKEMMYFTGDIVKWLPDGNLEFIGRIDNQIKIRGFRIELGEIESQILSLDKIKESVVIAKDNKGDKCLVAYYVSDEEIEVTEIKEYLSSKLSDYLVPTYFIQLKTLPLNINGKIDYKALPEPEVKADEEYIAPSNKIEEKLVEIWSEILEIKTENISINRSFFELGGHSLKATVMVNKIFRELNVEIPLTEIFIKQTVESIADYIITIQPDLVDGLENTEIKEITL